MDYCTLPPDINHCPYYNPGGDGICNGGPSSCGFYKSKAEGNKNRKDTHKQKWYEKYLK